MNNALYSELPLYRTGGGQNVGRGTYIMNKQSIFEQKRTKLRLKRTKHHVVLYGTVQSNIGVPLFVLFVFLVVLTVI